MISTSDMRGTGLKKCMPMKRSGRPVTAARRVMSIEDVLEARIAVRSRSSIKLAKSCRLCVEVLENGLHNQVASRQG